MPAKRLAILGSTGSVGTQALEVVAGCPERLQVVGLAAGGNVELLAEQVRRWRPEIVSVASDEDAAALHRELGDESPPLVAGTEGLLQVAAHQAADIVLNAVVGAVGLRATDAALQAGRPVALANKESLVMAGEVLMGTARHAGVPVLPVDSEPNALHQCLRGTDAADVRRLILTASGGPFLGWPVERLATVSPEQALRHPTWRMGRRITIDSATLMNKGFEVIESRWLFDIPADAIDVVIHPQSIVHSLIELVDGSLIAHAGSTDMRLPIQDALSYPERWSASAERLDLAGSSPWTFEPVRRQDWPALDLALRALEIGGTAPAAINAADEIAVEAFLESVIRFDEITRVVGEVLETVEIVAADSLDAVLAADAEARQAARDRVAARA